MKGSNTAEEHSQRQSPAQERDRSHGVHSQQQRAINPLPQSGSMLAQQQAQAISHHRLVMAFGPAHDLLYADRPGLRHFLITFRAVLIHGLPAMQQEPIS